MGNIFLVRRASPSPCPSPLKGEETNSDGWVVCCKELAFGGEPLSLALSREGRGNMLAASGG
ncbi:MAG: hypothetical protein JW395_0690 [Nitrospira sp.]|nr:hypothetical protein [Nitrospira sp.]